MALIDQSSLVKTLDNINEKFFNNETVSSTESLELASWLTSRQGGKGSYRGMTAPTPTDFEQGIRLFTGERLFSASARHIMGQEAARAAWLLGNQDEEIRDAYKRATGWMLDNPEFFHTGTFCCGRCTMAYWRHYSVGDFNDKEAFLTQGLLRMKTLRTGDGQWRTIPFFYAIYTLVDLGLEPASEELGYAKQAMETYLKRSHPGEYSQRKRAILTRALERIN